MNIEQKIAKLTLLVNEYVKYTVWTNVGVTLIDDFVFVTWFSPVLIDGSTHMDSTIRKFPHKDLDSRIQSYRNKINYEKKKRIKERLQSLETE